MTKRLLFPKYLMISKELKNIITGEEKAKSISVREYNRILKESKAINKKENKSISKIANKDLLKQRFVQLYCCGYYTNKQIADILLISENGVKKLLKKDDILEMILEYTGEEKKLIDTRIKALRFKAIDTINELLDSDDDTIRLNASKDILDRSGHKADSNQNINVNVSYEQQLNNLVEGISFEELGIDAIDVKINEEGAKNGET